MENGANNMRNISTKDLQALLQSETGQQLIRLLNEKDSTVLRNAAQAAQNGQYKKAFEALEPLLKENDASMLVKKLKERYG